MTGETPGIGHNSEAVAADHLRHFVERLERLAEEKQSIAEDMAEVRKQAKNEGFSVKALNRVLALRKLEREELDDIQLYAKVLGVFQ